MRPTRGPVLAAIAGALCISTSAVVMRLAGASPSMLALGRSGFALPVLAVLAWLARRRGNADTADSSGTMTARERWLARLAGVFLAGDLVLWAHSITDIGAGLGTVLSNLQVIAVPLLAWLVLDERPRRSLFVAAPVMLLGLALVGGLITGGGYGTNPRLGVVYGIGVAVLYSGYILMLRQAARSGRTGRSGGTLGAAAATLFQSTAGTVIGSLALGLALRDFRLGPAWPALGWLVVLALTSGVLGWLLITVSLPRLPAWLASSLLLVQPAGSMLLGAAFLRERPSPAQLAGVATMLTGVMIAARGTGATRGSRPTQEAVEKRERV